jgi:hypothetical protein
MQISPLAQRQKIERKKRRFLHAAGSANFVLISER